MRDPHRLSRGDWEALLHAPFHVYSAVAAAEEPATQAQFRALGEEIVAGRGAFPAGAVGSTLLDTIAANVDTLWAACQASGRSPKDGVRRARKALRGVPPDDAVAVRDWLLHLGLRIAEADRVMGQDTVSPFERQAIRDLAGWLDRPLPDNDPD